MTLPRMMVFGLVLLVVLLADPASADVDVESIRLFWAEEYDHGVQRTEDGFFCQARLTLGAGSDAVESVTMTAPSTSEYTLDPIGGGVFAVSSGPYDTLAAMQSDFDAGNYAFTWSWDSGNQSDSITVSSFDPTQPGGVVNPSESSTFDYQAPQLIADWTESHGNVVTALLYDVPTDTLAGALEMRGQDYDDADGHFTWNPGPLLPDTEYYASLGLWNEQTNANTSSGGDSISVNEGFANFNVTDSFTTTPEPATMALLGVGGLALLARRRTR